MSLSQMGITPDGKPIVMGILNCTPDSFYEGSRKQTERDIAERALQIVGEGGRVIDIGAFSTRPGADEVTEEEELQRMRFALSVIRRHLPDAILSIDTFRPLVARMAVEEYGANIINDVSEGGITGITGKPLTDNFRDFSVISKSTAAPTDSPPISDFRDFSVISKDTAAPLNSPPSSNFGDFGVISKDTAASIGSPLAAASFDTVADNAHRLITDEVITDAPAIFIEVSRLRVPYILMSVQKDIDTMIGNFRKEVSTLNALGVSDIILDPGYGFGKDVVSGNYSVLCQQQRLREEFPSLPILAGMSRKRMVWQLIGATAQDPAAMQGTMILNMIALQNGASILRVHDVAEAKTTIDYFLAGQC